MSDTQYRLIAELVGTTIVTALYLFVAYGFYRGGAFAEPGGLRLAGQCLLGFIVANVVARHIAEFLLRLVTSSPLFCRAAPPDERDQFIELAGMQLSYLVFTVGLLASLVATAMGTGAPLVLHLIIFSLVVGALAGNFYKLYRHRLD